LRIAYPRIALIAIVAAPPAVIRRVVSALNSGDRRPRRANLRLRFHFGSVIARANHDSAHPVPGFVAAPIPPERLGYLDSFPRSQHAALARRARSDCRVERARPRDDGPFENFCRRPDGAGPTAQILPPAPGGSRGQVGRGDFRQSWPRSISDELLNIARGSRRPHSILIGPREPGDGLKSHAVRSVGAAPRARIVGSPPAAAGSRRVLQV